MKHEFFLKELALIEDEGIREFTRYVLDRAPNYFFLYPASSTGKHHSKQSAGEGGLMRHSRAVTYFASIICRAYSIEGLERDKVFAACILHDIVKYGEIPQKFTKSTHDKEGADFVFKHGLSYCTELEVPIISKQTILDICKCIGFHAGQWTSKDRAKAFPDEYNKMEMAVHIADMCSAGKEVNLEFLN